jgi:hypothetical protein
MYLLIPGDWLPLKFLRARGWACRIILHLSIRRRVGHRQLVRRVRLRSVRRPATQRLRVICSLLIRQLRRRIRESCGVRQWPLRSDRNAGIDAGVVRIERHGRNPGVAVDPAAPAHAEECQTRERDETHCSDRDADDCARL